MTEAEKKRKEEAQQPQQIQRVEVVREMAPQTPMGIDPLIIIEQRNKLLEKVLAYAIAATHAGQWVDQNGKPWPTAAAAEVMARRCAVSVKSTHCEKRLSQDDKGQFYIYEFTGTFALPGAYDSIEALGTCSSRDQFLGTETSEGRNLSDIDEGNIQKAAYSNMMVNGVCRLLGVRNLTYEQLAAAGIDQAKMPKVEYNSGSKGGGSKADPSGEPLKFGRGKGKTLAQQDDENLRWYRDSFAKDLADPEKAKWKTRTEKLLAAADAEIAKRAKPMDPPKEPTLSDAVVPEGTLKGMPFADLSDHDLKWFAGNVGMRWPAPVVAALKAEVSRRGA